MKKYIVIGATALFLMNACAHHEEHNHEAEEHARETAEHAGHSDESSLTPEKAKAAGIVVETVNPDRFRDVILTSGQVMAAQGSETTLVAASSGVVSFSQTVTEGMAVGKGTELLSISAENLQDGDPVTRARITYERAKEEYERAEKLIGDRIVSEKEFNALKENYENARVAYEALSPSEDGRGAAVKSPISGFVKSCMVREGDYVTVGQPLLSVSQTRRLMLRAEVSERHYARLSRISSANFRTSYGDKTYSLDRLNGRLLSCGKMSGDSSYYIPVTFEFDNRGDIVPGSFAEVYLLSGERQGVISLPLSALTEEQGLNFVYVQLDAEGYRKQEVKTGASDGSRIEILSGLKAGDKVVVQGAIHVKLASASNSIPGHTHNH